MFERFYAETEVTHTSYNHAPAVVMRSPRRAVVHLFDDDAEGRIARVYAVVNPDKLRHLGPSTAPHGDGITEGAGPVDG